MRKQKSITEWWKTPSFPRTVVLAHERIWVYTRTAFTMNGKLLSCNETFANIRSLVKHISEKKKKLIKIRKLPLHVTLCILLLLFFFFFLHVILYYIIWIETLYINIYIKQGETLCISNDRKLREDILYYHENNVT